MSESDPATRVASQNEIDSIRTVYLSAGDHASMHAIARAQNTNGSALIRAIMGDYLNGELVVTKVKPRKTTVWVNPDFWDEVRAKTQQDGFSIAEVIEAGMERLRGGKK